MDKQTNFDDYTVPQKTLVDFGMTFNADKKKEQDNTEE